MGIGDLTGNIIRRLSYKFSKIWDPKTKQQHTKDKTTTKTNCLLVSFRSPLAAFFESFLKSNIGFKKSDLYEND